MSRERILVVEDEGIVALSLQRSLQKLGYEVVTTVDTGEEAVRVASGTHLDLVLMDIRLKGQMSGTEAAAQIRANAEVPVVYLTAYSDDATLANAKISQAYGYIVKPYTDRELHAAVEVALYNSTLERERRVAEEAVRARDRLLQDLVDNMPQIVCLRDKDGCYTHVNRAFETAYHTDRADVIGKTPSDLGMAPPHEELSEADRKVLEHGEVVQRDEVLPTKRGTRSFITTRFPLRNPRGAIYGVGEIRANVTDRKAAAEALAASERRYRLLAENSTDTITLSTPEGRIIYVSPSSARLLGYRADDLIGLHGEHLIHRDDLDMVFQHATTSVARHEPVSVTYRIRNQAGNYVWVESAIRAIVDPETAEGELVLGVTRDVTERVHAFQEIERLNADLERRVEQRTRDLRVANQELESFVAAVSHDIRSPLRGIDAYANALAELLGPDAPIEVRELLSKLRGQGGRAMALVEDLLRLATSTRGDLMLRTVDITELANSVLDERRARDPDRAVQTSVEDGLRVRADPRLMRILLTNLIDNAWKYSAREKSPRIHVGLRHTSRGPALFVEDNGIGFDPAKAEQLFTPFRRLENARTFEGTGVGLATVARIVHRHGGAVWAEAEPGRGAAFCFTLGPAPPVWLVEPREPS